MHEHHKSSLLLVENQHWRRGMPQKVSVVWLSSDLLHYFIIDLDGS